mmetsp:Transcript_28011/g.72071  ORF Transcript_28011/g.72071 Transcript_28011/m.72071 type:complete len:237 (-) Transcript_28011:309-1019(-)
MRAPKSAVPDTWRLLPSSGATLPSVRYASLPRLGSTSECHLGRRRRSHQLSASRSDPYDLLGLSGSQVTKEEIRAAYIRKMKTTHPDVSTDEGDATAAATALNLAYEAALARVEGRAPAMTAAGRAQEGQGDEFDRCSGPADRLFVNPFACNVDPFMWRELQEAAAAGASPEEGLLARGVYTGPGAVLYVTREQLEVLFVQLQAMELSYDLDVTAWLLGDMLARAGRANARQQRQR